MKGAAGVGIPLAAGAADAFSPITEAITPLQDAVQPVIDAGAGPLEDLNLQQIVDGVNFDAEFTGITAVSFVSRFMKTRFLLVLCATISI